VDHAWRGRRYDCATGLQQEGRPPRPGLLSDLRRHKAAARRRISLHGLRPVHCVRDPSIGSLTAPDSPARRDGSGWSSACRNIGSRTPVGRVPRGPPSSEQTGRGRVDWTVRRRKQVRVACPGDGREAESRPGTGERPSRGGSCPWRQVRRPVGRGKLMH